MDDASRPGDITIERPWPLLRAKPKIAFDVTVTSPLRQDVRHLVIDSPKAPLDKAREAKYRKYRDKLPSDIGLIPLAVSTLGAWEDNAASNLKELIKQQAANWRFDGVKLLRHFFERLSVILQRENGAMLMERSPLRDLPSHIDGNF